MSILEWIKQPWPWYVAGPVIGLTVPTLLIIGNKSFGISSSLRHLCAACIPANIKFFKYDWKKEAWNLFFIGGVVIGGRAVEETIDEDLIDDVAVVARTQGLGEAGIDQTECQRQRQAQRDHGRTARTQRPR